MCVCVYVCGCVSALFSCLTLRISSSTVGRRSLSTPPATVTATTHSWHGGSRSKRPPGGGWLSNFMTQESRRESELAVQDSREGNMIPMFDVEFVQNDEYLCSKNQHVRSICLLAYS